MNLGVFAFWRGWMFALGLAVLAGCTSQGPLAPVEGVKPEPPVVQPKRVPKLGLALGGGAARGFAHVGVLQVLEENGLRPHVVSGTSAGSLVAANGDKMHLEMTQPLDRPDAGAFVISPAIGEMVSRFDNSALSRPT